MPIALGVHTASAVNNADTSGRARGVHIPAAGLKACALMLMVLSGCVHDTGRATLVAPDVISFPASPDRATAPARSAIARQNTQVPDEREAARDQTRTEPDSRDTSVAQGGVQAAGSFNQGNCDVASYAEAMNQPRSSIDERTFSRPYRIIEHGEDAPQEHADRITFFLSENERIIDISCG